MEISTYTNKPWTNIWGAFIEAQVLHEMSSAFIGQGVFMRAMIPIKIVHVLSVSGDGCKHGTA